METNTLPSIDYQEFRRRLAGLADPDRPLGAEANGEMRRLASSLCSLLAELFGDDLDRLTLWGRIGTSLQTACAKVTDGNLDRFVSLCLEHVCADPARASGNEQLFMLLGEFGRKPIEWRQGFVDYVRTHIYVVISYGRQAWDLRKVELKEGAR